MESIANQDICFVFLTVGKSFSAVITRWASFFSSLKETFPPQKKQFSLKLKLKVLDLVFLGDYGWRAVAWICFSFRRTVLSSTNFLRHAWWITWKIDTSFFSGGSTLPESYSSPFRLMYEFFRVSMAIHKKHNSHQIPTFSSKTGCSW